MTTFTVTEVAKIVGKTRQTIHRYITNGKLSAEVDENKIKHIDESEIGRVFNIELKNGKWSNGNSDSKILPENTESVNVELLQYKVEALEKQLDEEKARSKTLLDIVESTTLALPKPGATKIGFFTRLFGE